MDRKKGAQELTRTRRTTGLSGTLRTVSSDLANGPWLLSGRSTMISRTVHQVRISTAEKLRNNLQLMIDGSQSTRSLKTKFWGDDEHPKVKICPKNYGL
jgi:hypothetical protein